MEFTIDTKPEDNDIKLIKKFIFAFPIPFFARGIVDSMLTHDNIRKAYKEVGGAGGMKNLTDAFTRIGGVTNG